VPVRRGHFKVLYAESIVEALKVEQRDVHRVVVERREDALEAGAPLMLILEIN
jgi:hypothetical protein